MGDDQLFDVGLHGQLGGLAGGQVGELPRHFALLLDIGGLDHECVGVEAGFEDVSGPARVANNDQFYTRLHRAEYIV